MEYGDAWHLGDYSDTEIYITYRTAPAIFANTMKFALPLASGTVHPYGADSEKHNTGN